MSSVSNDSLILSKKSLVEALGENHAKYFYQMKEWFRGKLTKEQFDSSARKMLCPSVVHLHNEFLLAILTKCQLFSTTPPPSLSSSATLCSYYNTTSNTTTSSNTNFYSNNSSGGTSNNTGLSSSSSSASNDSPALVSVAAVTGVASHHMVTSAGTSLGSMVPQHAVRTSSSSAGAALPSTSFGSSSTNTSAQATFDEIAGLIPSTSSTSNFTIKSTSLENNSLKNSSLGNSDFNIDFSNTNLYPNSFVTNSNNITPGFNNINNSNKSNNSEDFFASIDNSAFSSSNNSQLFSVIGSTNTTTTSSNNIIRSSNPISSGINNTGNILCNSNNNILSINNSCNSLTSLGTNTNAITINNSSSNISIKVEVPLHSLEGGTIMGGLGLGAMPTSSGEKKKVGTKPPKKKQKAVKQSTEPAFEPVNVHSVAPCPSLREAHVLRDSRAGHHTRSHCLLGLGELRGRLLLAAWDHGLNATTEGVVRLLHHAAKQVLQNVLTCVVKTRGGFRIREGRFVHSIGTCPPNPWLRSSAAATDWTADSVGLPVSGGTEGGSAGERPLLWPTAEAAQQRGAHLMAFAHPHPPPLPPISCFDLYTALKVSPSVLPCHTVYSLSMERLSSHLSHPDHATLAQEDLVRQEQQHRHQLRQGRLLPGL